MAEPTYPNRVNTQGIPTLLGVPSLETIGAVETLVINFQPHKMLNANWSGLFLVEISGVVAPGTQPVVFRTVGQQVYSPLYTYNGIQALSTQLVTTTGGVVMCMYNKDTGRLQLMGRYEI